MKRFLKPFNRLLSLLPYLTVFIFAMYSPSDPDLGWHLKYGEYFMRHGNLLWENTFSTLMPGYEWANTSWMTDVISYVVFQAGGFLGLTLLGSLIVTLTFFFFSRIAKLTLWDQAFLFPLLLYVVQPVNAISFRGQQLSLLLIGVLFYLISFYPNKPKVLYLTIPLFLLWANLHGQFIFGLALFTGWIGLYLLTETLQQGEVTKKQKGYLASLLLKVRSVGRSLPNVLKHHALLFLILFMCVLVTIINPFGIGIHTAALSHFGSPLLKNIGEYLPFEVRSQPWWNQVIVGIGIVMGCIVLFFKGKLSSCIPLLGVSLIVYALSFGVRRYAWPAYYMILPMLQPLSAFLRPDSKKVTHIMTAIFLIILFGVALASRYPFTKYINYNWNDYCATDSVRCSPKSAEFLKSHEISSDVYTLYGWGGYLIWNHPEVKPLIDGRMHLWKDKSGYSGFVEYYAYEQNFEDIDKSPYQIVYMSPDKPIYNRLTELVKAKRWKMVYRDDLAGVFVRLK